MSEPLDWNAKTIAEFRANQGRVGGVFEGAPIVLAHHRGRKSGREHVTPMMYLPHDTRRRAIQGSEKITPVDQPGSCWSHRHRPAFISTPDTLAPVTQSWHLLSRYQASERAVNGGRTRSCRTVIHAPPPRSHPVPRHADAASQSP